MFELVFSHCGSKVDHNGWFNHRGSLVDTKGWFLNHNGSKLDYCGSQVNNTWTKNLGVDLRWTTTE